MNENQINPQSQFVYIERDGKCLWGPHIDQSETQCHVDVTWFPFDTQKCELHLMLFYTPRLVFESGEDLMRMNRSDDAQSWQLEGACWRYLNSTCRPTLTTTWIHGQGQGRHGRWQKENPS